MSYHISGYRCRALFEAKIPASGAGEMIVMPSYLIHLVHPNHGKDSRAIVGTNASFGWPRSYQTD
ncbi:hypothetical protein [Ruegeria arenilitoris]|uniref:hypothetical protein n=1 Tax=Ruegeria arenilitoris TaxID=1173585 RepID=UPI00147C25C2|nr:hypothetical protein [Ruegeria arenilitoris]